MSYAKFKAQDRLSSCQALSLVIERVPSFTLCTDTFSDGVYRRTKQSALLKRHIQLQSQNTRQVLLFDLDLEHSFDQWDQVGLPVPTWICLNPQDGHAHYGYALDVPITGYRKTPTSATAWYEAVYAAMNRTLCADPAYNQSLTKNPLHPHWHTYLHDVKYSLGELAEYLDPKQLAHLKLTPLPESINGRNDELFNRLRKQEMKQWHLLARASESKAMATVEAEAVDLAQRLFPQNPLPLAEIKQVARSVGRWLHRKYSAANALSIFKLKQRFRQLKSAAARRFKTQTRGQQALDSLLRNGGKVTIGRVAALAGCSRQALYKSHKDLITAIHDAKRQLAEKIDLNQ